MLKPFYQGKLDAFCAIYAVINAYRLTRGLRTAKAVEMLNETLLSVSASAESFRSLLYQKTDYVKLVDWMLAKYNNSLRIDCAAPFIGRLTPTPGEFWDFCQDWLGSEPGDASGRTVVFRFLRHIAPDKPALNRHWTTVDHMQADILHLFDCSHEAEAILNVRRDSFVTRTADLDREHLLCIPPECARFLRLRA